MKNYRLLYTLIATLAVAVTLLGFAVNTLARNEQADDDSPIPTPPPGHRYCTNGKDLGFCRDGSTWR